MAYRGPLKPQSQQNGGHADHHPAYLGFALKWRRLNVMTGSSTRAETSAVIRPPYLGLRHQDQARQ